MGMSRGRNRIDLPLNIIFINHIKRITINKIEIPISMGIMPKEPLRRKSGLNEMSAGPNQLIPVDICLLELVELENPSIFICHLKRIE